MRTAVALAGAGLLLLTSCAIAAPTATPPVAPSPPPATAIPSAPSTPTAVPTHSATPTATAAPTATASPSATGTASATPTATHTPTRPPATSTVTPTPRATATLSPSLQIGSTLERGGSTMVAVTAGNFLMGSRDDPFAFRHETPQHSVYLDAYWIDRFEVTNALYARCVAAAACQAPRQQRSNTRPDYYANPAYERFPVLYVAWVDARAFCAWSGKRLPTEAEWEKAARGPDGSLYPWGDAYDATRLNSVDGGPGDTVAVGSFPAGASVYGAHDLAGNAWEFVADFYEAEYYRLSPLQNPRGPSEGPPPTEAIGVMRGGAWNNDRRAVRSANRLNYFQRHYGFETTIRCAADI